MSVSTNPPNNQPQRHAARTPRSTWIGFALITGVLIGATTGLLTTAGGVAIPLAIVAGGGAMFTSIGMFITLVIYATGDP